MRKSIFLALTSFALLFSCSKSEQITIVPVEQSTDLSITIAGSAQMSQTKATENESKITQATAFVFRGSQDNAILDCTPITLNTSNAITTAKVTAEAQWVFIVANKTVNTSSIKTLGDLKAVTAQLFNGHLNTQQEGNLIMWGANSIVKSNPVYTTSVVLKFAPAKVTYKYTVSGANAADLTAHNLTIFNAQGVTRLFPANTVASSKADNVSLLPAAAQLDYYAGKAMTNFVVQPQSYTIVNSLVNETINTSETYTYYLFENDETHPTIFTLSGTFGGKTLYYPITFSSSDSNTTGENTNIKAGEAYDITVNIKNILAGSSDPTQPNSSQDIEVTVVPAEWETVISWIKDFE